MTSKTDNTLLAKMDIGKGLPAGVVLGLIFGIGFGDWLGNLALGLATGIVIGVCLSPLFGLAFSTFKKNDQGGGDAGASSSQETSK